MTPSKRRRAARAACNAAWHVRAMALGIAGELYPGGSPDRAGPTPAERAEALRLAARLVRDAERLRDRIMRLECDR